MDLNAKEKSHISQLMNNVLSETASDVIQLLQEDGGYKKSEAKVCLLETEECPS